MMINSKSSCCIFCKLDAGPFTSVEHIVPESLGNTEHILPRGIVCDPCNNYFACKIEGPILASGYFREARHWNEIGNKRKRIPTIEGVTYPNGILVETGFFPEGVRYLRPVNESDNDRFVTWLQMLQKFEAIFPVAKPPEQRLFSRFLMVIGLRALASRMLPVGQGLEVDDINNSSLDEARAFARYDKGSQVWPYHETRIYPEGKFFDDSETKLTYDIPHEFSFLSTDAGELYFVIAIFGIQYSINMGGPEIGGFHKWLEDSQHQSPLYPPECDGLQ